MKPAVSIIVPVYNSEKYLRHCLDTITNQTLKNIEIIIVDDESTDSSADICLEYATCDDRIKIIYKKNAGLGLARNTGIENATGEYITFADSDDYVDKSMYEQLYKKARRHNADCCLAGKNICKNNLIIESKPLLLDKDVYIDSEIKYQIVCNILGSKPEDNHECLIGYSVWMGIYSLDVIKKNNIKFYSEREYIFEDVLFNIEYFSYSQKVSVCESPLYCYCMNEESLTHIYREDRIEKDIVCYYKELQLLERYGLADCKIYADRMILATIREQLRQIMQVLGFWKSIVIYKNIAADPKVHNIVSNYPYYKNPILKRIFNYLLDKKISIGMALIIFVRLRVKKGA